MVNILFWFYKDIDVCRNRLQLLRQYNPDVKIFGLFGGTAAQSKEFQDGLDDLLDDFYMHPSTDKDWKWIHGDLMILDWYSDRGQDLEWELLAVVQWDMLVFGSLREMFNNMQPGQLYLSGYQTLSPEIESKWHWTRPDGEERHDYDAFRDLVAREFDYHGPVESCLFVFQVFSRNFFDRYMALHDNVTGMLEYKVPTYAKIFGIEMFKKDLGMRWFTPGQHPLNAHKDEIPDAYIHNELEKADGWRLFHPYFREWKSGQRDVKVD